MKIRIDLRFLIVALCLSVVAAMLANSLFAAYRVQRQILIDNTLEANRAYAAKLADTTSQMMANARAGLAFSAMLLAREGRDAASAQSEVERLWLGAGYFNSVVMVDAAATLRAAAPSRLVEIGTRLESAGTRDALRLRRPIVTTPFIAHTGRMVVVASHPVISAAGEYKGYIGGSFYLHENNFLQALLGEQVHHDDSHVYVVDGGGRLIYHPEPDRVGDAVGANLAVAALVRGEAGAGLVVNTRGVHMLAGYAPVEDLGWGVVVQRPLDSALGSLQELVWQTARHALPLLALMLVGIAWTAHLIARPLSQMATFARHMGKQRATEGIARVRAWYYEASEMRHALLAGLSSLHGVISELRQDSLTDALTGLLNRRGLEVVLKELRSTGLPFGVVSLDVDHFKRINDSFGHATGDGVLRTLAEVMRQGSRAGDVLCRVGGEEFLMLLPHSSLDESVTAAERLRLAVQASAMPHGQGVTVSLGVAHRDDASDFPAQVLARADAALYEAKRAGRNRVAVAGHAEVANAAVPQ